MIARGLSTGVIVSVLVAAPLEGLCELPDPTMLELRAPPGVTVLHKRPANEFRFLPKSMQKSPLLDILVITELTIEGRRRSVADVSPRLRYAAETGEYLTLGLGSSHPPARMTRDLVHRMLENALTASGLVPVDHDRVTPDLLIVINWGMHIPPDYHHREHFLPQTQRQDFLERLALIGGEGWARGMTAKLKLYNWEEEMESPWNLNLWNSTVNMRYSQYLETIVDNVREPRVGRLLRACHEGVYFTTAAAYDYEDFARGIKTLLWRTKMTVPVSGLNMTDSLPQLALSATPYFGRETGGPLEISIRITRGAVITIGDVELVELDASLPAGPAQDTADSETGSLNEGER